MDEKPPARRINWWRVAALVVGFFGALIYLMLPDFGRHARSPPTEIILLHNLALPFAAFGLWLTVRIINRRERWAKWTAVALALPVVYVASFGPACWLCQQWILPQQIAWVIFRPVTWLAVQGPPPIGDVIRCYAIACGDNQNVLEIHLYDRPVKYLSISPSPIVYEMIHSKKALPPPINPFR